MSLEASVFMCGAHSLLVCGGGDLSVIDMSFIFELLSVV